ncbi:MAG: cytochrome c biogenesis protein CcdA, partial [Ilumatobacteraceae bacterium]
MSLTIASIALYGAGITSTISPCVLPLRPGYLAVLADGSSHNGRPRPQRVLIFALGAIGTFVALGGLVAAVGLE